MLEDRELQPIKNLREIRFGTRIIVVSRSGKPEPQYLTIRSEIESVPGPDGEETVVDVSETMRHGNMISASDVRKSVPTGELGLTMQRSGPSEFTAYLDNGGEAQ